MENRVKSKLDDKVIYIIATGCNKAKDINDLTGPLAEEGANVIIIPTDSGYKIGQFDQLKIKCHFKSDNNCRNLNQLPEEDLIVVAPCSFNTLNKISHGIADNYPLSLIHNAIGKGKPVIISLAMNYNYWNNFNTKKSLTILSELANIYVIWPEIIYDNGQIIKVTMASYNKTIDSVFHILSRIRFNHKQEPTREYTDVINEHYQEFKYCGEQLALKSLVPGSAGCLAKKISQGILITSSGTKLENITPEDISLVTRITDGVVFWQGNTTPSSETPLIYETLADSNYHFFAHGHSPLLTYCEALREMRTQDYHCSGIWSKDKEIKNLLAANNQMCILKLHGQIVLGNTVDEVIAKFSNLQKKVTLSNGK